MNTTTEDCLDPRQYTWRCKLPGSTFQTGQSHATTHGQRTNPLEPPHFRGWSQLLKWTNQIAPRAQYPGKYSWQYGFAVRRTSSYKSSSYLSPCSSCDPEIITRVLTRGRVQEEVRQSFESHEAPTGGMPGGCGDAACTGKRGRRKRRCWNGNWNRPGNDLLLVS